MANQPIPVSQANDMIQNYLDYMRSLNADDQTQSVSFNTTALLNWMNSVKDFADEFRIFFGAYSDGTNKGRITTIIWPYKDGEPATRATLRSRGDGGEEGDDDDDGDDTFIDPFNEGGLSP